MNQIFCFKRYVLLLKRQWYENATNYKLGIALLALLIFAIFGLMLWISAMNDFSISNVEYTGLLFGVQIATFVIIGIVFLILYGARFFRSLSSKHRKMFYFSLPVSPVEQVAVAFTFVLVFMPVLIFSVFNVFDFIAVQLFNHIHGVSGQMLLKAGFSTDILSNNKIVVNKNIFEQLFYISILTLGSLMFGKKGPVVSIAFLIVFLGVSQWFLKTFDLTVIKNYTFVFLFPVCWIAMYFVMKRKEA